MLSTINHYFNVRLKFNEKTSKNECLPLVTMFAVFNFDQILDSLLENVSSNIQLYATKISVLDNCNNHLPATEHFGKSYLHTIEYGNFLYSWFFCSDVFENNKMAPCISYSANVQCLTQVPLSDHCCQDYCSHVLCGYDDLPISFSCVQCSKRYEDSHHLNHFLMMTTHQKCVAYYICSNLSEEQIIWS